MLETPNTHPSTMPSAQPSTKLKRSVGMVVVALSALSQEYGSGINFVMPHSLSRYPGVQSLVPWAMLVAGLLLIPQVFLFARYGRIMPRAGSTYVWLTRSSGPYPGFMVAFLWFVGICGAIGFLSFASGTFVADAFHAAGLSSSWATSKLGHLLIGLAAIWIMTGIHISGIKNYGYLIYLAAALIFVAAGIIIYTGFAANPHDVVMALSKVAGHPLILVHANPSVSAFISTIALFMFAYGGLTAATSLGGEVGDPGRSMPRGIVGGWALALVLYTFVAFSLFHAVPWWSAIGIIKSHHAYLLTAPALVGLIQTGPIAVFINVVVAVIVIKTIAPQLLDASRYLYAWSEDGIISTSLGKVNKNHVPSAGLVLASCVGSLFLLDAIFAGWAIGVIVRAASIVATFIILGLGTLLLSWWPAWRQSRFFSAAITQGMTVKILSFSAIVIGIPLIASVIYKPGAPWYFEPWFQILVSLVLAAAILRSAISRTSGISGKGISDVLRDIPVE